MMDLKYTEILNENRRLGKQLTSNPPYKISVLSNIVVNQISDVIEYKLRSHNINAIVNLGDYDNIVQDSEKFSQSDAVIVFWELSNLVDGLFYKSHQYDVAQCNALIEKITGEISFVFKNLATTSVVLINKFSSLVFNSSNIRDNMFDTICKQLNAYITDNLPSNFTIIKIDKIIANLSIGSSVDLRYFYSSKALYSIEFFKAYSTFVSPVMLSILGKSKKALIFDCDNTLWKGIVGEDGVDGIELSSGNKNGIYFEEIHNLSQELAKQGIIIGLCSKNNSEDVEEVFAKRTDFSMKREGISIVKVNWNDKANNLREIASELNIGLDSLVFLDDSDFEVNFVSETLPEVSVVRVPDKLYEYPKVFRSQMPLFYNHSRSVEDLSRVSMYKEANERKLVQATFSNLEDYLYSLELKLDIQLNEKTLLPRIAQLTQKTNQFNLTTKRYTETEIDGMLNDGSTKIFSFSLEDKFGGYGTTGLSIVKVKNEKAEIDTFLMSCRVIGREVEIAFLDTIINNLAASGIEQLTARYVKTLKNGQVAEFYELSGFSTVEETENTKLYKLNIGDYKAKEINHISINFE